MCQKAPWYTKESANRIPFHTEGPTIKKVRFCFLQVHVYGQKGQIARPLHEAEEDATSCTGSGTARIAQVGRNKFKQTPPNYSSNPEYDLWNSATAP